MSLTFTPARKPFPQWHGPYPPARGNDVGFRVRGGQLVTIVDTDEGQETWIVRQCSAARALQQLIRDHWGGGRVLILPNGLVVKPSPAGDGQLWVVGRVQGPVVLERPDGSQFNLARPGRVKPGDLWEGPKTTGIECVINAKTGSLRAASRVPTSDGFIETLHPVWPADAALARGFRAARPGESGGRVRITANGHVITNRKRGGEWESVYVGLIDGSRWPHRTEWAHAVVRGRPRQLTLDEILEAVERIERLVEIVDDLTDEEEDELEDESVTEDDDADFDDDEEDDDEDDDEDAEEDDDIYAEFQTDPNTYTGEDDDEEEDDDDDDSDRL